MRTAAAEAEPFLRTGVLQRRWAVGLAIASLALATLPALARSRTAPEIVPRSAWGAKPAHTELMRLQTPREIIIHHTAVRQQPKLSLERKLRALQSFSQTPGSVNGRSKAAWGDLPYHFYIDAGGRIGEGRDVRYAGDSNTKYDTANRIQIVLEGHFDEEQPTPGQLRALDRLVVWLAGKYRLAADKISAHDEHAATACPGRHLKSHLPVLRDKVARASPAR